MVVGCLWILKSMALRYHFDEATLINNFSKLININCCKNLGKYIVKPIVIKKLLQSINELETAIAKAKVSFAKRPGGEAMIERIKHYEEMLNKQKSLTTTLCGHAVQGNWNEVNRHVKLINGLSLMIRDDARELLNPNIVPVHSDDTPSHYVS